MRQIDKDRFGTIDYDSAAEILRLDWTLETEEMSVEDFKRTATVLADAALEYEVPGILVNVREFRSGVPMEIDDWRLQNIVPKYNKVVSRFAWLAGAQPPELLGGGSAYQNEGEHYKNCWFREEEEALKWLRA